MDAKLYKLHINIETSEDLGIVNSQFQALFNEYGKSTSTLDIQIAYADFLTFKYNQPDQAIKVLKGALKLRSNNFQKGAIKIKLGEVLVFNNRFNEALIYFSQVQASLKNHILAQKARFKVAQTSYYKGDFDWAETQLKVLKGSTSQLIANDALDLSLIINDNIVQDSLRLALKTYAQADLLAYQHKNQQAVDSLNTILTQHKGHAIEDEALFKQAKVFEEMKLYEKAESNYLKIIKINAEDILVDDAYYNLGEINSQQNNIEKAKEYYQKIIFDFPSSIHLVDARKKYRKLRGDDVIK
jgi:tetratricopeptide (TPR) repeat protein